MFGHGLRVGGQFPTRRGWRGRTVGLRKYPAWLRAGSSPARSQAAARIARPRTKHSYPTPAPVNGEKLTPREHEIVRGIEDGLNYKFIAERLFISPETVRNHIRHVYRKLQSTRRVSCWR